MICHILIFFWILVLDNNILIREESLQVTLQDTAEVLESSTINENEVILNVNNTLSLVTNSITTPTTSTTTTSFNAADSMVFSPMLGTNSESEVGSLYSWLIQTLSIRLVNSFYVLLWIIGFCWITKYFAYIDKHLLKKFYHYCYLLFEIHHIPRKSL